MREHDVTAVPTLAWSNGLLPRCEGRLARRRRRWRWCPRRCASAGCSAGSLQAASATDADLALNQSIAKRQHRVCGSDASCRRHRRGRHRRRSTATCRWGPRCMRNWRTWSPRACRRGRRCSPARAKSARLLGMTASRGTITVGKQADLLLLDGIRPADIRATRRIHAVIQSGRVLDRALARSHARRRPCRRRPLAHAASAKSADKARTRSQRDCDRPHILERPAHVAAERHRPSSSSRPPRSLWPHRSGASRSFTALDAKADHYGQLSRAIWEAAEVGYKETKSSALLRDELKAAGFRIDEGVAGMPTAFVATWGSGKPVIGIMGEFDALPGLSQETVPEQKPRVAGAPGHGCGHNLLGVASLAAALAVKAQLEARKLPGTIRYYGTPGRRGRQRQGLHGARRRSSSDADVVLHWHPNDRNIARARQHARGHLREVPLQGHRRARGQRAGQGPLGARRRDGDDPRRRPAARAHPAGVAPALHHHQGRRRAQHRPRARPRSTCTRAIRRSPSSTASGSASSRRAEAGALATGTTMEMELVGSTPELLPNEAMTKLLDKNLREVGGVTYTAEERAFAADAAEVVHARHRARRSTRRRRSARQTSR